MKRSENPMAVNPDEKYTYADYLTWPEEERWELIDGVPFDMSPAPTRRHQGILTELIVTIGSHLRGKLCKVYSAPFDVKLIDKPFLNDEEIKTVVQPDLVVYCDKDKLDDQGGVGVPDLAVEILSPSTAYRDQNEKFKLYMKHGLPEYWIVIPEAGQILVYRLQKGEFSKPECFRKGETLTTPLLPGLEVNVEEVFQE